MVEGSQLSVYNVYKTIDRESTDAVHEVEKYVRFL